jgi:hypothetical protein
MNEDLAEREGFEPATIVDSTQVIENRQPLEPQQAHDPRAIVRVSYTAMFFPTLLVSHIQPRREDHVFS